jgi:uncharacterized protein
MTGPAPVRGLIIYTRFPEPGSTKTRLIPVLGAEGACRLHRQLTENIIAEIRKLRTNLPMKVEVHFSGGSSEQMAAWLGRDWDYVVQVGGDIGARMERSFEQAFRRGWNQAILIGSDLPEMTGRILREAFRRLDDHELVLGPAQDGGYYLIGLKAPRPELFGGHILWGTPEVLKKTLLTAKNLGLKSALLEKLKDVDRPEDLAGLSLAS